MLKGNVEDSNGFQEVDPKVHSSILPAALVLAAAIVFLFVVVPLVIQWLW